MGNSEAASASGSAPANGFQLQNAQAVSETAIELEIALRELQNEIKARGFLVCRVNLLGVSSSCGPNFICGNLDSTMVKDVSSLDNAAILHMRRSFLPFNWSSRSGETCARGLFLSPLKTGSYEVSGLGFPAVLGRIATGYCLFFGQELHISNHSIFEVHQRTCEIVRKLFLLDRAQSARQSNLSSRERSYLQLVANGFRSEAIANEMGVSVNTVNSYLIDISKKLNANSRMHSVSIAIRFGLIV
ncbi:response regulator transcription factor [Hoeflea sp.]|uniref:helix-turn-helix transcriptional regulator n=1 Tax=Hoeflea sp. TaxID=1940281 RepID=UPI003B0219E1